MHGSIRVMSTPSILFDCFPSLVLGVSIATGNRLVVEEE